MAVSHQLLAKRVCKCSMVTKCLKLLRRKTAFATLETLQTLVSFETSFLMAVHDPDTANFKGDHRET